MINSLSTLIIAVLLIHNGYSMNANSSISYRHNNFQTQLRNYPQTKKAISSTYTSRGKSKSHLTAVNFPISEQELFVCSVVIKVDYTNNLYDVIKIKNVNPNYKTNNLIGDIHKKFSYQKVKGEIDNLKAKNKNKITNKLKCVKTDKLTPLKTEKRTDKLKNHKFIMSIYGSVKDGNHTKRK